MSSSRQLSIPALALLAMFAPPIDAATNAQTQSPPDPAAAASARAVLGALIAGKCPDPACTECNPAQQSNRDSRSTEGTAAEGQGVSADQAAQETLVASGGISASACRAVGLNDDDTGEAAQLKGAAAALITGLEDLRDNMDGGAPERLTTEGQIGAVARACAWAVSRLPKQPA